MSSSDLWSKQKKNLITTRKDGSDRSKHPGGGSGSISDQILDVQPKEEDIEKVLAENRTLLRWDSEFEVRKRKAAYQKRLQNLATICQEFEALKEAMLHKGQTSNEQWLTNEFPTLRNHNRIIPWVNYILSSWYDDDLGDETTLKPRILVTECVKLLSMLDRFIKNTGSCSPALALPNPQIWFECKSHIRQELYLNLDVLSHQRLINIEKEMSYLNGEIMYYREVTPAFRHLIWTPTVGKTQEGVEKPILCADFKECQVMVTVPKTFSHNCFVLRCVHMFDDLFTCDQSNWTAVPRFWNFPTLYAHNVAMHARKERAQDEIQRQRKKRMEFHNRDSVMSTIKTCFTQQEIETKDKAENENFAKGDEMSPAGSGAGCEVIKHLMDECKDTAMADVEQLLMQMAAREEKDEIESITDYYKVEIGQFQCNPRMYHIIGGVFHLDLVCQPPQPKTLKDGLSLRLILGEDRLKHCEYLETYEPPVTKTGQTRNTADDEEDDENTPEGLLLGKLVLVTMKLPEHVLWFDTPLPVLWDHNGNFWSREYIYEVKMNEEKQTLSFRAGKMGALGLATYKFNNLPFQSWELKGTGDIDSSEADSSTNCVIFTLTTSILVLEFEIRADEVILTQLENANTSALQELVGVSHKAPELVHKLRTGGVNIFPSDDAFLYMEGAQLKHRTTEDHLYFGMAKLASIGNYCFSWSRWNAIAGYRKFVAQIRPNVSTGRKNQTTKMNQLLVVSDQKAMIVETSVDVMQHLDSQQKGNDMKTENCGDIAVDLLSVAAQMKWESVEGKFATLQDGNFDSNLVQTVYYMLLQTKIMSYS